MAGDSSILGNRVERALAFMVAACVGIAFLSILAIIVATFLGVGADNGFSQGVWPVIIVLPAPGLILGLLLVIILIVVSAVRRARDARDAR
ncbi:MAG TPA: hypothetical protein VN200_08595 [Rhodoglobus sp.]|nr:hypothetical protein [Rhodoglobus sp.]